MITTTRRRDRVRRTGIEQEFAVLGTAGQVDFQRWTGAGRVPGCRLDAGDPGAHRLSWGGVITADDREAEIATPPEPLHPGFTTELITSLGRLRMELGDTVAGYRLEGVSTHLNVEVPDRAVAAVAHRFALRHAAAMMLLLDRRDSPGLLVRPRRSRLELGGEYATGRQLTGAMVFAAAAAVECQRHLGPGSGVRPVLEPARERFGWYVDRGAFGTDLYRHGRAARIGPYRAQDLLDRSWERVRRLAEDWATDAEVATVDDLVTGRHPLPCEEPDAEQAPAVGRPDADVDMITERHWAELTLRPMLISWDHAVCRLSDGGDSRVVALPSTALTEFLADFSSGRSAEWCRRVLCSSTFKTLASTREIKSGGVFDDIRPGFSLNPAERDPLTGRLGGPGSPSSRQHKHDSAEELRPRPQLPPRCDGSGFGSRNPAGGRSSPGSRERSR
jgi:hypothetical protein